ncbi:membrane protein insertion efficiency factor YidD [Idiomarina sp. OT37-5b]|uniref:Putative membrane protein insertion efficiency factor n=1 Tax=Idiomarina aquatica TaxID=1327752 RepID=A0AA94EHI1_9GAMM|nr:MULTISPECIES: membrane protein insertion efficiency factor YidD [Idiomarina]AVJ57226.1 membrane protein insertion efficiency factor YidD [Idiomarina sp. OT37-5b]RUO45671.1 membrane protein insertion efficiency factor YidD [Idiomarina aquatica]
MAKIGKALRAIPVALIKIYQWTLSPLMGPRCRFYPSCSHYACEAIEKHGTIRGVGLAAKRIARCHPGSEGGFDPVPDAKASHNDALHSHEQ